MVKAADPGWMEAVRIEFIDPVPSGLCPECGNPVYQNPRGRRRRFCSDKCRFAWKNKHPNPGNWKSTRTAVCPVCGREFLASREYKTERKYCSRACANRGRVMERRKRDDTGETAERDS